MEVDEFESEVFESLYSWNTAGAPSRMHVIKSVFDRVAAAMLLIPGLPLTAVLMLLVKLESTGPGIFQQTRVGKHGRLFTMYKLRTMRNDAEEQSGAVWSQEDDPRITRLGRLLRKTHLDELPQLVNVLRGEMSLVGPRPERPQFVIVLSEKIDGYVNRLSTAPGVTGLAQINLPPDADLDSVRRKQILDVEYVNSASVWFDARILLYTCLRLFGLQSETLLSLLQLRREVHLSTQRRSQLGVSAELGYQPAVPAAQTNESHQLAESLTNMHVAIVLFAA